MKNPNKSLDQLMNQKPVKDQIDYGTNNKKKETK